VAHRGGPIEIALVLVLALALLGAAPGDGTSTSAADTAHIGAELAAELRLQPADVPLEVIVSFDDRDDVGVLADLGVTHRLFQVFPFAGALLTPAEVEEVARQPEVRALHLNSQLDYHHPESVPLTGAPDAWDMGFTGEGVTVAILDTGIDGTHPDVAFPDKTVQNLKFVHTKFASWVHGEDTETVSFYEEDLVHTDTTSGHGTHVAGTAAGDGSADPDHRGVAPGASLVGIGAGDDLFIYEALKGFEWLFVEEEGIPNHERYGIRVINNSWGGGGGLEFDPEHPIMRVSHEAYAAGITVVFAAGNSGPDPDTLNFYATAPWNLGVAATDKEVGLVGFSSRGYPNHPLKQPDVAAPGQSISSAHYYTGAVAPYSTSSGTSMASPHVAGLVAVLLEANPDLSPDQVAAIIREAAAPMDGRVDWEVGGGFIDVVAAVEEALATDGELAAFLDGATAHTPESAAATELPYERVEEDWDGLVGPGALGVGDQDTFDFTVDDRTEFLTVAISWDRLPEELQIVLVDPDGERHVADPVILGSAQSTRLVHPPPGEWTAIVRGYVSTATTYVGTVVEYRTDELNWPPPADVELRTLHMRGNVDDGCLGQGHLDVEGCGGPWLSEDDDLSAAPAARWGPFVALESDGEERSTTDPNWLWELDEPVTVGGPMTLTWWAKCVTCTPVLPSEWTVSLWADGERVFSEGPVTAALSAPGIPELLEATVDLPKIEAEERIVVHIAPHWTDMQGITFLYDSAQPCSSELEVACDSRVTMPIVDDPDLPDLTVTAMSTTDHFDRDRDERREYASYEVAVTATVTNEGPGTAEASHTRFRVDDGTTVRELGEIATPTLGPDESAEVEVVWDVRGVSGDHTLIATVDARDALEQVGVAPDHGLLDVDVRGNRVTEGDFRRE
jgi:serine protease AprX